MALAFGTLAIVLVTMLVILVWQRLRRSRLLLALRDLPARIAHPRPPALVDYDPGRELRAEQRARALLRSCVNEEEWSMYCELGFLRVQGSLADPAYAYLIYPHKPILAYLPDTGLVVGEYCVEFPDNTRPYGSPRLPDSDDVLAKWIALNADERLLIAQANMHLPGRQIRVAKARRDISRLAGWEREQLIIQAQAPPRAGSVAAL
jgi:hypothetical protein